MKTLLVCAGGFFNDDDDGGYEKGRERLRKIGY